MSNSNSNTAGCESLAHGGMAPEPSAAAGNHILSIAAVARMFNISTFALRLYELRGLIRRRRVGKDWLYSWSDCERLALLVKARMAGLPLRDIAAVLRATDEHAPNDVLETGRRQCLSLIRKFESDKKALGNVLEELLRIDWELAERLGVEGKLDNGVSVESL
jgi:DNA-binding transcriptional MerR regulator